MTKKSLIKLLTIIACSLVFISFLLRRISGFDIYKHNNFDRNASVEIQYSDGNVEKYNSTNFPIVNKGDTVFVKVDLPKDRYIENSSICLYIYHSIISIYDDNNNLLYTYGGKQTEKGEMIGGIYVAEDIPNECWGKSLIIKLEVQENKAYSKINDIMIIKSRDSYKYLMVGQEIELLFFVAIFTASILITIIILLQFKWNKIRKQGLFLSSFLALISLWFLEYNGMLNIFIENKRLCANIEYIALFFSPILLSLFFYEQAKNKKVKRIQLILTSTFGIAACIFTLLNYFTVNYHYCNMIFIFHIMLTVGILVDLIIIIIHEENDKLSSTVVKYGAVFSLIIIFLEMIRYNIIKYIDKYTLPLDLSFTAVAVVVFVISIVLSYIIQLADHYISEFEKINLEKLAYYDGLTGISNRAGCYRYFENVDDSKENAVVFIDLNNLKYANDEFGHQIGDELIKFVAKALKNTFKEKGFYGRLGGDEFVAGIYDHKCNEIYEQMNSFNKILSKANEKRLFPVKVSVSYGISISNKDNPVSVFNLIKEADEKMYENKRKYKEQNKIV